MPRRIRAAALFAGLFLALFIGAGVWFVHVDRPKPAILSIAARYEGAPVFAPAPSYPEGLIDLNSADLRALDSLPGIGETLAARIVEARPFYYLEDVLLVKGIGDKRFQDMRPFVAVYGEKDTD